MLLLIITSCVTFCLSYIGGMFLLSAVGASEAIVNGTSARWLLFWVAYFLAGANATQIALVSQLGGDKRLTWRGAAWALVPLLISAQPFAGLAVTRANPSLGSALSWGFWVVMVPMMMENFHARRAQGKSYVFRPFLITFMIAVGVASAVVTYFLVRATH